MNKKTYELFGSMILIAAFTAITAFGQGENYGGGRLGGTWDANVTIYNCETGDPITSFLSTATFNQGGTFTGITSGMPPAARTPEVGVWRHVNKNTYTFRFKAYQFNSAGLAIAYQILTHDVVLNDDNLSYTSAGSVQFYNMNGVLLGGACSNAVGTRMTL